MTFAAGMVLAILTGCGGGSGSAPAASSSAAAPAGQTYDIVIGSQMPLGSALIDCEQWIIDQTKEKMGGRFTGTVSHSGQLGSQREIIEATNNGVIQASSGDSGTMVSYNIPECEILTLPYLFDSFEHFRKARPVFAPMIAKALSEKTNMIILFHSVTGFRNCYLKKPVRKFADMKGLKIRTPENKGIVEALKALSANPTPIPSNEMYSAIQTGVVDGMEGTSETIFTMKIHEVTKYGVITQQYFNDQILLGSKKFVESMDAEDRKIFLAVCEEAGDRFVDIRSSTEDDFKKKLQDKGMEFIDVELDEFRNAVQGLWSKTIAAIPSAKPVIDGIRAAAK
jgi:TRAP-type C4-dicarboxylate transport system substrate-binding protein